MRKNTELPKLKIETELYDKMEKAIKIIQIALPDFSLADFRRLAYTDFSKKVIAEGLNIQIKPKG